MPVNKVIYAGTTLIDISDSTVTAETLKDGVIAYDAKGNRIVGTMGAKQATALATDYSPAGNKFSYTATPDFSNGGYIEVSISDWTASGVPCLISIGTYISSWFHSGDYFIHIYGRETALEIDYYNGSSMNRNTAAWSGTDDTLIIHLDSDGLTVNGTQIYAASDITSLLEQTSLLVGSQEGSGRSYATYNYIKYL